MLYNIEDISELGYPRIVRMSFELPYLDWCRFENSALYRDLIAYLLELQKTVYHKKNKCTRKAKASETY